MLENIFLKIKEFEQLFPAYIKCVDQNRPVKEIAKYIGRFPGKFDSHLFQFLTQYSSLSIVDIIILGVRNKSSDLDLAKFTFDNWMNNNMLSGYFISFGHTSSGQILGLVQNYKNNDGSYAIGCLSDIYDDNITIISSSFPSFINILINELADKTAIFDVKSLVSYFIDILSDLDFWKERDVELNQNYTLNVYKSSLLDNWKLANGLFKKNS